MDKYAIKEILREYKGRKYKFPKGVLAKNVQTDGDHQFLTDSEKRELKEKPGKESPVSDNTVTFGQEPAGRNLLTSGSKLKDLFPQINTWLRGLAAVAFTGRYTDLANRPELKSAAGCEATERTDITVPGYVADARTLKTVNDKFGEMSLERSGNDIYAIYRDGADTVRKKLGSGGLENLKKISHNDTVYYDWKYRETERKELWYGGHLIETRKDLEFKINLFLPKSYLNFTTDNFYLHVSSTEVEGNQTEDSNVAPPDTLLCEKHYNMATGILTISNLYASRTETRANDHGGTTIGGGVKDFELLIIE